MCEAENTLFVEPILIVFHIQSHVRLLFHPPWAPFPIFDFFLRFEFNLVYGIRPNSNNVESVAVAGKFRNDM